MSFLWNVKIGSKRRNLENTSYLPTTIQRIIRNKKQIRRFRCIPEGKIQVLSIKMLIFIKRGAKMEGSLQRIINKQSQIIVRHAHDVIKPTKKYVTTRTSWNLSKILILTFNARERITETTLSIGQQKQLTSTNKILILTNQNEVRIV